MHLVTGGAGFLGSHLVEALVGRRQPTRVLDVEDLGLPEMEHAVEMVRGDLRDPAVVATACAGVEVIYHAAAMVPLSKAGRNFASVNVEGTRTLYEAALRAGVRKVVEISSSAVYGIPATLPVTERTELRPLGRYGQAKYEAEQLCEPYRRRGLRITIIRPRTIVGQRRLGIFHILYDWIRRGKRVYLMGGGKNRLQLLSARDAVAGCLLAAERGGNTDYNLGSAEFGTLREDLQRLIDYAETGARLVPVPAAPARWALRLLDCLNWSPLTDWHYRTLDQSFYLDITKAERELGWQPQDGNVGMLITSYQWYLDHRRQVDQAVGTRHRLAPKQGFLTMLRWLS